MIIPEVQGLARSPSLMLEINLAMSMYDYDIPMLGDKG